MKAVDISEFIALYPRILKANTALNLKTLETGIAYLAPRLLRKMNTYKVYKDCVVFGEDVGSPLVIPLTEMDPKSWVRTLLEVMVHPKKHYGGLNYPYAEAICRSGAYKMGDKTHEYLFSTQFLVSTLSEGRSYRDIRRLSRRYEERGYEFKMMGTDEREAIAKCYHDWEAEKSRMGVESVFHDYVLDFYSIVPQLPPELDFKCLGVYKNNELLAYAMGIAVATDTWGCVYCHGVNEPSLMNIAWLRLALHYQQYPYECDGNSLSMEKKLDRNKRKFLSPDVERLQPYSVYVKRQSIGR